MQSSIKRYFFCPLVMSYLTYTGDQLNVQLKHSKTEHSDFFQQPEQILKTDCEHRTPELFLTLHIWTWSVISIKLHSLWFLHSLSVSLVLGNQVSQEH